MSPSLNLESSGKPFFPEPKRIQMFDRHCILIIKKGQGIFQVDFRNYHFNSGRAIFLSPGQYFQLITGWFEIDLVEFPGDEVDRTLNSRFLFKHLVSLGYIELGGSDSLPGNQLKCLDLSGNILLNEAISHWVSMNPFRASKKEVNLLFDLKDIVDDGFKRPISFDEVSKSLREPSYRIKEITKSKLQTTIKRMARKKLLLEAQRKVAFSDWTVKEIAYELGFSDPPYFNRFFKALTNKTPFEFREDIGTENRYGLITDLHELINIHYRQRHSIEFYADHLHMSPKSLSRKVKELANLSVSQMIREKLVEKSKECLNQGLPVNQIALELGFAEANHFSAFFKKATGMTPTGFKVKTPA